MKIVFILLGLIVALSLITFLGTMVGLIFINHEQLLPLAKTSFVVCIMSAMIFTGLLIVLPHGKAGYNTRKRRVNK